jgi:hypothetical protein
MDFVTGWLFTADVNCLERAFQIVHHFANKAEIRFENMDGNIFVETCSK